MNSATTIPAPADHKKCVVAYTEHDEHTKPASCQALHAATVVYEHAEIARRAIDLAHPDAKVRCYDTIDAARGALAAAVAARKAHAPETARSARQAAVVALTVGALLDEDAEALFMLVD